MPHDDLGDLWRALYDIQKALERTPPTTGGDGDHPGSGFNSVQLGPGADASGASTTAVGYSATATGNFGAAAYGNSATASGDSAAAYGQGATAAGLRSVSIGSRAYVGNQYGIAIGRDATVNHDNAMAFGRTVTTDYAWQIKLGSSGHTVDVQGDLTVAGTFSNPSARRLKCNIEPAPILRDVFPNRYEWEYKADEKRRRHLGPMADDLVDTEAERFVTWDDEGRVAGIDTLGLYGAQIAALHAENTELRAEVTDLRDEVAQLRALITEHFTREGDDIG